MVEREEEEDTSDTEKRSFELPGREKVRECGKRVEHTIDESCSMSEGT